GARPVTAVLDTFTNLPATSASPRMFRNEGLLTNTSDRTSARLNFGIAVVLTFFPRDTFSTPLTFIRPLLRSVGRLVTVSWSTPAKPFTSIRLIAGAENGKFAIVVPLLRT